MKTIITFLIYLLKKNLRISRVEKIRDFQRRFKKEKKEKLIWRHFTSIIN